MTLEDQSASMPQQSLIPNGPVSISGTDTISAPKARMFQGMNVVRDPYVDGTLLLDKNGLRFVDPLQQTIFTYSPQDIRHITLGVTRMSVTLRSGSKFAISLDATTTLEEVHDIKAIGYAGIGGSVTGMVSKGVALGVGVPSLADVSALGKAVDRDEWAKQLKAFGYPTTDLSFKNQMLLGAAIGTAGIVILVVAALLLHL